MPPDVPNDAMERLRVLLTGAVVVVCDAVIWEKDGDDLIEIGRKNYTYKNPEACAY